MTVGTFLKFLKYLPAAFRAVVAVEEIVVGAKRGDTKKKIILDAVTAGVGVAASVDQREVQVIGSAIDGAVSALNAAGVFTKSE